MQLPVCPILVEAPFNHLLAGVGVIVRGDIGLRGGGGGGRCSIDPGAGNPGGAAKKLAAGEFVAHGAAVAGIKDGA